MDQRTTAIVVAFVTIVLCGLPGLAGACLGSLAVFISFSEAGSDASNILLGGMIILGLGVISIAIAGVVGFWVWRKMKKYPAENINELIPPAI